MLTQSSPRMITWLFLAVLGVGGVNAADQVLTGYFRFLAGLGGAVAFFGALAAFVNWAAYQAGQRLKEVNDARTITERVKILQAVSRLTPDQVRLMESESPVVTVLAGEPSPLYCLRLGGGEEIPFAFIYEFLNLGRGEYLCPISTWSEGSRNREWAQQLTDYFIVCGFAAAAVGNKPARWLDRARALRWIGANHETE